MTKELKQELQKDFTIVGSNTRQGEGIKNRYAHYSNLRQCYNSYSGAKERAFEYCKELEIKYNGFRGGINSYCINNFTYVFEFEKDGCKFKAWITKANNYLVEL